MNTKICILAILLIAALTSSHAQDTWTQKANFGGGGRYGSIGFSIGSKGYIGTGYDFNLGHQKDLWAYDPSTNAWTQKANLGGVARESAVGFVINGKGYVGTGYNFGGVYKDFWEYDPLSNAWTRKADFGGTARYVAVGFSIASKGYIGTGSATDDIKKDFWEYDSLSNTWIQKADFGGVARYYSTGFSVTSKGYIGTGFDGINNLKDFWEYDPASNGWSQKADFGGTARDNVGGISIGTKGYFVCGNDGSLRKDFWEYDPAVNSWTQKADFGGAPRWYPAGFSIGNKGYVGTGIDYPTHFRDFWEYTAEAAQAPWIELAPTGGPPRARELLVAVYDPATNRMIIHGGGDGTNALNDAWVLTNADGTETNSPTWTKLLPANPLRRRNQAAVYDSLTNRMVIFGGEVVPGGTLNDVWVLTNANGTGGDPQWVQLTPSGGPPSPRENATGVYDTANNRMTIFGGDSAQGELGDVWVLTNANGTETISPSWIQLFPSTQITPRTDHTAVYDVNSNRMIVFGGGDASSLFNDVWVLTNANGMGGDPEWVELAPDGTPPSPRISLAAAYDPTTNRMVVFGGSDGSSTLNDTWVLANANGAGTDTATWVALAPGGTLPTPRTQFAATYSVSTNRLSIFAGDNSPGCCTLLNDVWVLPDANGIAQTNSYRDVILADNPIMYWRLGETCGTIAYDESANHRDATYIHHPSFGLHGAIANDMNTSVGFNGCNQWAGWIPTSSYSGAFTVEAWVKEKEIRQVETFFNTRTKTGEFSFDFKFDTLAGKEIHFDVGDGTQWLSTSGVPFDFKRNVWYYVAAVVTRRGATYYVDGSAIGSVTYRGIPLLFDATHKVEIGTNTRYDSEWFDGAIDEVAVYDCALAADQIAAHYATGTGN